MTACRVIHADALRGLASLDTGSVQCVVTSPPYWGLRDYGTPPTRWEAGGYAPIPNVPPVVRYAAWRGQLGLEPDPGMFVGHLVQVFREVRRVLAGSGVAWLNLGDSYVAAIRGSAAPATSTLTNPTRHLEVCGSPIDKESRVRKGQKQAGHTHSDFEYAPHRVRGGGLKPKDLCLIPQRAVLALQADGWWVRKVVIWAKPNPMPESVEDRCTSSHEYLFHLAKSEQYQYDADAIREPHTYNGGLGSHHRNVTDPVPSAAPGRPSHNGLHKSTKRYGGPGSRMRVDRVPRDCRKPGSSREEAPQPGDVGAFHPLGRNKRDVWTIATEAYPRAHFATFPRKLVEPCILAGSRPGDVVCDPFAGSGTTGEVATRLGRRAVLIEPQSAYLPLIQERLASVRPLTKARA